MIELNHDNVEELIDTYDDLGLALREIVEEETADDVAVIDHWWYNSRLRCFAMLVEVDNSTASFGYIVHAEYVPFQDVIDRVEENRKNRL